MSEGELPTQVRGLIDVAHRAPVGADRAAIRARIGTTLGTTAGATTAGALKLVIGAAISLVAVGGIYLAMRGGSSRPPHVESSPSGVLPAHVESEPEPAVAAAPSPIVEPVPAPELAVVEHPLPSATDHAPRAHVVPVRSSAVATPAAPAATPAPPPPAPPAPIDEATLLANATRALAHGDFDQALTIVEEHARRFANGVLAEERAALELEALLGLGRGGDAAVAARRFASSYPHSVHAPLVERALHQGSSR